MDTQTGKGKMQVYNQKMQSNMQFVGGRKEVREGNV